MAKSSGYLDPATLSRIGSLELRVRQVVEGYLSGLHRSPYHGVSVEFAEHRPYSAGDETKHVDWKLWARSDRFYLKLYEAETNVRAYLLMDGSQSMAYASGPMSKFDYGATLAASLAYLLLRQQDAVGLTLFDTAVCAEVPPAANPAQLRTVCDLLGARTPQGETDLGPLLHAIAGRLRKRGLAILVSDLLGPLDDLLSALQRFRYDGHALIVVHVMDRDEAQFPFDGNVRFHPMEGGEPVTTDARQVRRTYLEAHGRFVGAVRDACAGLQADYLLARTDRPLDTTLARFLVSRNGQRG